MVNLILLILEIHTLVTVSMPKPAVLIVNWFRSIKKIFKTYLLNLRKDRDKYLDITDDKFEEFKIKTAELMKKDVKKM